MANSTAMFEIQVGVVAALKADAGLTGLGVPIFDEVTLGQALPYVEVGEITETLDNTFSKNGRDVVVTLHVYSEQPGYAETEKIVERLNVLLDDTLLANTTNWRVLMNEYQLGSLSKEFDSVEIRHAICHYRFIVEQIA